MVQEIRVGRGMAAVGAILLAASCSSGGGEDEGATTAPATSAEVSLAAEWQPKLRDLGTATAVSACQTPSSTECADALEEIATLFLALEAAIAQAGAGDTYRETLEHTGKMWDGLAAYREDCAGNLLADLDSSPCYGHALDVAMGPANLDMTLSTDESRAGIG